MEAFEILDVKEFTKKLFMTDLFDKFSVIEAEFTTFVKFDIGGKLNKAYFDEVQDRSFCTWSELRHICFEIIKGKRTPTAFKLVLKFSEEFSKKWIGENTAKDIEADMYLNIRYADKKLELISSFSPKTFLLERDILNVFDTYVKDMFKKINITLVESGSDNEG
jgi:hypothetical protein